MADHELRTLLNRIGGWDGFVIAGITTEDELQPDALGLPAKRLVIELRAKAEAPKRCSRCGTIVAEIHDVTPRRIRDLPIAEWDTWLIVPRARLQCPSHVYRVVPAAHHENRQIFTEGIAADPFQHRKAVHLRQTQVQKYERGKRMFIALFHTVTSHPDTQWLPRHLSRNGREPHNSPFARPVESKKDRPRCPPLPGPFFAALR